MAVGSSTVNLANRWLDMLGGTAFTAPAGAYAKLHTADPGAAGATAAAVGDATRKQITWGAAASGSKAMTAMASAWTNGGTTETITHVSVWDASTAGNFLYSFALTASQAWVLNNTFSLTSHSYALTPLAA